MMDKVLDMLKQQGHDGDVSKVVIVGDRFDTDIRAGKACGIMTCLVESGCHNRDLQR